jgi:Protein of unknown function (DUF3089)
MTQRRLGACAAAIRALRPRRSIVGAALACALLAPALAAGSASAESTWLCRPGLASNPCLNSEESTVRLDGGATFVEHAKPATNPPIDCFYVYPTVSGQFAPNSTEEIQAEEIAIAESQASRFSQVCKVYAPMYPQITLPSLNKFAPPGDPTKAYLGVQNAFIEYLEKYNDGRGFELIGHSQGSAMLESLINLVIEPNPTLRKQLVGADILGGNVIVPEGKKLGGTFKTIPACSVAGQTGCVVAYSSFLEEPPEKALFGRPGGALGGGSGVEHPQVLCVNPTVLAQGPFAGPSLSYYPTFNKFGNKFPEPFFLGPVVQVPKATTPWVATPAQYSAKCEARNGASWLQLTPTDTHDTRTETVLVNTIPPVEGQQVWGQHLVDVNAQLGNLVAGVAAQGATYLFTH